MIIPDIKFNNLLIWQFPFLVFVAVVYLLLSLFFWFFFSSPKLNLKEPLNTDYHKRRLVISGRWKKQERPQENMS